MARVLVEPDALLRDQVILGGDAYRHLVKVLRVAAGEHVVLFDGDGAEADARVLRVGSRDVEVTVTARRRAAARTSAPVTLLQGLPRHDRMDWVVEKATELGVARIVPVRTARTTAGLLGRPDRWRRIASEAARQCGRIDVPEVAPVTELANAVAVPAGPGERRLVPWEDAGAAAPPLRSAIGMPAAGPGGATWQAPAAPVTLLIGPEGGLTAAEVEEAKRHGFEAVTLGRLILRTETAAIATLAIVQAALGALD